MEEKTIAAKRVGKFGLLMQYGGWVFALFLAIGLFVAGLSTLRFATDRWVLIYGQETTALVTDLAEETYRCGSRRRHHGRTCASHKVSVRFEADGRVYSSRHNVDETYWNALAEGDQVKLRYLEKNPSFNRLVAGQQSWSIGVLAGLLFAGIGGFGIARRLRLARRLIHLRSAGLRRQAKVTKQVKILLEINDRRLWKIEWLDEVGETGESRAQWQSQLPEVGAEITVYVDPEGKLAPAWEGDWA